MTPTTVTEVETESLRSLPIPARPRVDAADVKVPEGYEVEPVVAGLSYPNGLAFADDGTLYITEAGNTLMRRPFVGAQVLALYPDGNLETATLEKEPIMGVEAHGDHLYLSLDGSPSKIVRYDRNDWTREVIIENPSAGGTHPVNGPRIGPDGLLYFGQGAASINGVMDLNQFRNGAWRRNPKAHDVPGQDVTLAGHNYESPDPRKPFPMTAKTGAFKPFGTKSKKGERVQGRTLCTTGIFRSNLDGSDVELVAWGIREGFGFAWDDRGELYVGDNNMSDSGTRPVGQDPDRIWHVKKARQPHGSIATPSWHGFPDICADGKPVTDDKHAPKSGPPEKTKRLLEDPPKYAGKAAVQLKPHVGVGKMEVSPGGGFGHDGELFVALVGSLAPATTPRKEMGVNGFQVARVNLRTGRATNFMSNRVPGPAFSRGPHGPLGGGTPQEAEAEVGEAPDVERSAGIESETGASEAEGRGRGGIERPVDVAFDPNGDHMYVLDVGRIDSTKDGVTAWARTGVLWRISPEDLT